MHKLGRWRRPALVFLALAGLAADVGCSHFRARRRATGSSLTASGAEAIPGPISTVPAGSPTLTPEVVEPAASAPTTGSLTPMPEPSAFPGTANDADLSLRPPIPAGLDIPPVAATSVGPRAPAAAPSRLVSPPAPAASPAAGSRLVGEARAALDSMTTYQLSLRRQERVNDALLPAEDLIMSIRRAPKAARLTWADGPHRGREVLYRADEPGGLMHVNMADSKLPLPRLSIAPDSPMVMKNSRHPITEAGLDPIVASLEEADRAGTLSDLPPEAIPGYAEPLPGVLRRAENGDVWRAFFDPRAHLPALVECRASNGDLVESYLFRDITPDPAELATAAAFNPDVRWGAPRGLFGRAARTAAAEAPTLR